MTAKRLLLVVLALPLLLGWTEDPAAPESGGSGMLGKIVNFVILFGALVFFLRKPVKAMLAKKTDDIRASLEEARAGREAAEAKLAESEARFAAIEDEVVRIKALAQSDANAEKDRLRALAESEAARIRVLAAQDVDAGLKAGIRDLKAYAAELAAGLAEERIKARLTGGLQGELIDRSIEQMGKLHEESGSR